MDTNKEFVKLRELFSDENAEVPNDLNWEFLEGGIIEKMKKKKKSKRPIFIIFFFLVTFGIIILGLGWSNVLQNEIIKSANTNDKLSQVKDKKQSSHVYNLINKSPNSEKAKSNETYELSPIVQNTKVSSADNDNKEQFNQLKDPITTFEKVDIQLYPSSMMEQQRLKNDQIKDTVQNKKIAKSQIFLNTETNLYLADNAYQNQKDSTSDSNDSKTHIPNYTEAALTYLPLMTVNEIQINKENKFTSLLQQTVTTRKPNLNHQNYITLSSGITYWDMGYGSVLPERQPFEQTILSYHSQLSYTRRFNNNLTLMVGIRHQKLETRFNWNSFIENYNTITLRDTIIEIQTNSITGQQSQIRGDVDVNVNANRRVQHFNQYQVYQIPFAVGKVWPITQRWFAEISVGGALNVLAKSNGRNLYERKIIEFDSNVTPFMNNRWGFNAMGSIKLGYKISKNLGLLIDVGVQKSLTNWSTEASIQMQPLTKNLGIGISYSL